MPDMSGGTEDGDGGARSPNGARGPIEDVIAEYETYSGQVADLVATLQDPPMSETMLPMGDLGTHPMAIMPSTFLFDNYCHLRNDILKPNGPIDRPEPPRDEMRLQPTIEWMLAGLPWMCASQLAFVDRPITLDARRHRRRHVDDRARRRRRSRARERRAPRPTRSRPSRRARTTS